VVVGRRYVTFIAIVFAMNLVWENAHGGLYDHTMSGWDFLRSAGGDVLLVLVGMVAALPWRRASGRYRIAVVIVLTALAVGVELFALSVDRWTYTDAMPTLGPIGLSPLLQLPTTAMVAFWLTDHRAPNQR